VSRLPDPKSVPRRLPGGDESSLDVMAHLLLDAVDGRSSIAALGDACGVEADLAARIVVDLARRGVLAVPGWEPEAAGDSVPPGRNPSDGPPRDLTASEENLTSEVERVFHYLRKWNFYEILGVAPDADRKVIRSAYFALSKKFHPDRAFGADTADLRKKMEVIFRRLTQAYEVITNAEQRVEYDSYIADQIAVWKMERQLLQALKPEEPVEGDATAASPPQPEPSPLPEQRPATPSRQPEARPEHDSRRKSWQRERAQRMLKQALGKAPGEGGRSEPPRRRPRPEEIEDTLARGVIAMEAAVYTEAVRLFTEVLTLDPGHERAAALLADAKAQATRSLAAGYLRQGRYERLQGDVERARASLSKAVEIDPQNLEALYQLADLLFSTRADLSHALALSREVIARGGQKARYFAILGELMLLAKETERARESFSRAVLQEPDNKEYRKRLKACDG
jgi:tetratricopeptide (TPR) repeat protein